MAQPLRLLVVDDKESDVALLQRLLKKSGLDTTVQPLEDPERIDAALDGGHYDAILLDYVLPGATAPEVLKLIRGKDEDIR